MTTMTVTFIGATRRVGTSKKTGAQYDMCKLAYAIGVEHKKTEDYTYTGCGSEVKEIDLSPTALPEFTEIKTGQQVKIELSADPRNPRMNICSGLA